MRAMRGRGGGPDSEGLCIPPLITMLCWEQLSSFVLSLDLLYGILLAQRYSLLAGVLISYST